MANKDALSAEQLIQLVDFIELEAGNSGLKFTRPFIFMKFSIFSRAHDINALGRYFFWAQGQGKNNKEIFATIMHDLNGVEAQGFSPRISSPCGTAGY